MLRIISKPWLNSESTTQIPDRKPELRERTRHIPTGTIQLAVSVMSEGTLMGVSADTLQLP